jgi:hypothetical protein
VLVDDSGRVWLAGFGLASRLPRERPAPAPPEILAGTLGYPRNRPERMTPPMRFCFASRETAAVTEHLAAKWDHRARWLVVMKKENKI